MMHGPINIRFTYVIIVLRFIVLLYFKQEIKLKTPVDRCIFLCI